MVEHFAESGNTSLSWAAIPIAYSELIKRHYIEQKG